ncbi:hypothetical protein [Acinetobacter pittii]|uniref:hypothetical protein n=1 Tax=Acinetobacter pittii TaxID=48296 RepID=UPI00301B8486
MAQDDLRVKIKKIWLWIILGIIFFLIISFFLKSSYPLTHYKFNLLDAYEVLKDSLSLAAAFLAPIAAFVLFSDWRVSHRLINNEREAIELLDNIKNVSFATFDFIGIINEFYEYSIPLDQVKHHEERAFKLLSNILEQLGKIDFSIKNFSEQNFHKASKDLLEEQYKLLSITLRMFESYKAVEQSKKEAINHSDLDRLIGIESHFSRRFFELSEVYLKLFDEKISNLEELADVHRIK